MRLVQLSDLHVVPQNRQPIHGVDTLVRLRASINIINTLDPLPNFVVVTGDQTHDEADDSYQAVKDALSKLRFPCHLALGNHDCRSGFRRIMLEEAGTSDAQYYYSFDSKGYKIVVLDTLEEGKVSGKLDDYQLDWLEQEFSLNLPTIVCMHHPPIPVGVPWMDALILNESDRFLRICRSHDLLKLILCGHVHHEFRLELGHATVLTAPSVGPQFRKEPIFETDGTRVIVTGEPAAFRIIDLDGDGWKTKIHQLAV